MWWEKGVYEPGCLFQDHILSVSLSSSGYGKLEAKYSGKTCFYWSCCSASGASVCLSLSIKLVLLREILPSLRLHFSETPQGSNLWSQPLPSEAFISCTHVQAGRHCQQNFSRKIFTEESCKLVGITCLPPCSLGELGVRNMEVVFTQALWDL